MIETIKPHHLLDIVRDIGAGRLHEPHPYGHDFHRIAALVREDPRAAFTLTLGADSVCAPCRHLKAGVCTDTTDAPGYTTLKEEYNRTIDRRLMERLGLSEGQRVTVAGFCRIVRDRLGDIYSVYAEADREHTAVRAKNIGRGVEKIAAADR